jgi:hypothetical protein
MNDILYPPLKANTMILDGIQEIIGRVGLYAILNLAHLNQWIGETGEQETPDFSPRDFMAIRKALEDFYGPRGGRGVLLRSGRTAFNYMLRVYGEEIGLTRKEHQLLPLPVRIREGLDSLAIVLSAWGTHPAVIGEDAHYWYWELSDCPWCLPAKGAEHTCPFQVGFLQEYLQWASGGRIYHVLESTCRSSGQPACITRMDKVPLD